MTKRKRTKSILVPTQAHQARFLLSLMLYMLLMGAYYVLRFEGRWAEIDSNYFTMAIRNIAQHGQLVPPSGEVYPGGFGYQSVTLFLIGLTGLDIQYMQQIVYPLLASLVVLPAWILYREVTGSARGATITTMLLFTQPEFLFVIIRGSHEKFTRTFMLLCLFFLFRSFTVRDNPRLFARNIMLFYLPAFAFAATNNALAMSFFLSIGVAVGLRWAHEYANWFRSLVIRLFRKRYQVPRFRLIPSDVQRLLVISITCIGLVYIVVFYAYPIGQGNVSFFTKLGQESLESVVVEESGPAPVDPYAYVKYSWTSGLNFLLVSIGNWIVLASAVSIWFWKGLRWIWKGDTLQKEREWLPWLLFASFGIQAVGSVIADMGGGVGNIQVRLFPSISMISVMLVGSTLAEWKPRHFVWPIRIALSLCIAFMAIAAALKATNEPILSNKWIFYRQSEVVAMEWTDRHLRFARIWTEFDERLWTMFNMTQEQSVNDNRVLMFLIRPREVRTILLSDVTRLRSSRMQIPIPLPPQSFRVYDNGEAQLYHVRPRTPHQE